MIRDIIHKKRGLNRVALQWIMLWDFTTTTTTTGSSCLCCLESHNNVFVPAKSQ